MSHFHPFQEEDPRASTLMQELSQAILAREGFMSFADYMQTVLYHEQSGYYTSKSRVLGREGDFMTAPMISPLFAMCVARQCHEVLQATDASAIVEFGPGTGHLAAGVLQTLKKQGSMPTYYLIETSPVLRAKQQAFLAQHCIDCLPQCFWVDEPPAKFHGVMLFNEVLDALPAHLFAIRDGVFYERGVGLHENGALTYREVLLANGPLQTRLDILRAELNFPSSYVSSIHVGLPDFLDRAICSLQQGVLIILDYGYARRDYYHVERTEGTLSCFYQHHYHSNPFLHLGSQDITTHVDFTHVAEWALSRGLAVRGYTSQAAFLLGNGLHEVLQEMTESATQDDIIAINQGVKTIMWPSEMGECVKAMALARDVGMPLSGFLLKDRRHEL